MMRAIALVLIMCAATGARAGDYQSSPPRQPAVDQDWGQWLGPYRAGIVAKMGEDFGEQYIYAAKNAALPAPAAGEQRVVFIGDSITDRWDLAAFFPGKPYVNRGIGGQVTPQMLVRFHADVVALKPRAVVILAGVNDLHGVLQVESDAQIVANYRAMAEIAQANGIEPIFTLILPLNNYTPNAAGMLAERSPQLIAWLNAWLMAFCRERGYGLIDYGTVLRDGNGLLKAEYTADGIHPNDAAYAAMAEVAERVIEAVLDGRK
ncbi:GDSL-like Lipase/Acylhydrolase family protein [Asticcacaulis biprosthecium C19]|uniref:GDSL-like Lipase/Acylhydrolase family protein n=1 Tax=Asticcacaulis biprosthecium C19 TaxID=715226 RepID=F4QU06_9CAUL|nr:GDSL-type esterase/lipase family protein [Asticcacaulis biprosthecium]EGF89306.1 GDSL-like Lipase/Acylhydrolase family protein [Asticcacaulis biprosthecium C19]